jgi:hypothetical protein
MTNIFANLIKGFIFIFKECFSIYITTAQCFDWLYKNQLVFGKHFIIF